MLLFLFLLKFSLAWGLFCSDILDKPDGSFIITPDDLKSMDVDEIDKCVSKLGLTKMPIQNAKIIWDALIKVYGGPGLIPEEKLQYLRWITPAIEPKHYRKMTLSSIDVIENFGLFYDLSNEQLAAIAHRVKKDFGGKRPEDYTSYDLIAMRQIICSFDPKEILRIHVVAYKDAASALGTLKKCPLDVLRALATLATDERGFGSPARWGEGVLRTVGGVREGLSREAARTIPKGGEKKLE